MKLACVLAIAAGCTGENIGFTPLLGPQNWTIGLGGDSTDAPAVDGVAFAADGNIVVTGVFRNTADFGSGPRTTMNPLGSVFISKRSIVDGSEIWTNVVGAAGDTARWVTGAKLDSSGNIMIAGRKSPVSLYNPHIATMEADPTKAYNQDDATGFIRLNGLRLRVAAQVQRKKR